MRRRLAELLPVLGRRSGWSLAVVALLAALALGAAGAGLDRWAWYDLRAARQAHERHRLAEARQHVEAYLRLWPRCAPAHFLAARVERRAGACDDAERHLDACEQLQGGPSAPEKLERILLAVQRGDLSPETESYLAAYVERDDPEAPLVLEALAHGYLEVLRPAAARDCLDRCLRRQPDNIPALLLRGQARERLSRSDAVDDYRRVLELDPDQDEARLRLAGALFLFGRADAATGQYEVLLRRHPDDAAARLGLARCRLDAGRVEEARQLLDGLVAEDPHNQGALKEEGRLALEAGRGGEAERWLRQALPLDPADRETNHLLARALQQQGKTEEASAQQERTNRLVADLTRLGEILNREMPRRPRDPALLCELGVLYLRHGKGNEGARWLARALQCDPAYAPARQALADYSARTADPGQEPPR